MRSNTCIIRISPNRMPIPSCWPVLLTVRNGRVFLGRGSFFLGAGGGVIWRSLCELVQLCFTLLVGDHWSALYLFKSRPKTLQVRDWFIGYDWLIATLHNTVWHQTWDVEHEDRVSGLSTWFGFSKLFSKTWFARCDTTFNCNIFLYPMVHWISLYKYIGTKYVLAL